MKFFSDRLIGWLILLCCAAVVIWHSICIVVAAKFNRLTRSMVNQRLRHGALQLLRLIDAKQQISFVADFNMQANTPYIFMANHLSLFDLPLLYATISGTTRFLVKKSLFNLPIFGAAISQAEFIPIDMDNADNMRTLFDQLQQKFAAGIRLFIFPEGTRSRNGKLGVLKSGGFRLARELGAQIIPIAIVGTDQALPPKSFLLTRGQNLSVRVGHPINTAEFKTIESQKVLMDKIAAAIQALSIDLSPSQRAKT